MPEANLDLPPAPGTVRVKIDNIYEDDYRFVKHVDVPAPSADDDLETEDWWEDNVWEETGGRPGPDASLDAGYFAEIVELPDEQPEALVGMKWDWC